MLPLSQCAAQGSLACNLSILIDTMSCFLIYIFLIPNLIFATKNTFQIWTRDMYFVPQVLSVSQVIYVIFD